MPCTVEELTTVLQAQRMPTAHQRFNHIPSPQARLLMPPEEELTSVAPLLKEATSMFLAILFVGALPLVTSYVALSAAHDPKSNDALLGEFGWWWWWWST